ncbi:MAG: hypothetical protein C0597_02045 [Marinilabiliales bacterium]|nr:MAG: hypothetical protein C0597_02045 [Marinilabiliales bacterium]
MQDFAFVDETLDINLTQSYYLSIQLSLNGLSFCILDSVREKYIAFQSKSFPKDLIFDDLLNYIEDYIDSHELLKHKYKATKLIWETTKNTLVPNIFFKKENLKTYFEFNQKLDDLDEIHYNELKYVDAYSVFVIPNLIANVFVKRFEKIQFYNQQSPFIEHTLFKHHSETKRILINLYENFFDLCVTENGKLLLYNNFLYKNEMDLIYFILYAFDQFSLETQQTELIISGLIDRTSKSFLKLKEFIKHIRFEKLPDEFSYSYTFNQIPSHKFTNLFNLHLCE